MRSIQSMTRLRPLYCLAQRHLPSPIYGNAIRHGTRSFVSGADNSGSDFFAMFSLPRRFELDETLLKNNYRNLMKEIHPDKQQAVSEEDNDTEITDPSVVTHAYVTLKRPHTRATYLMELLGHSIEEDASSAPTLPPAFLMEMMEQREALEEATAEDTLQVLWKSTVERIEAVGTELQSALDADEAATAQQCAAMLQYYHRMEQAVVEKMDRR